MQSSGLPVYMYNHTCRKKCEGHTLAQVYALTGCGRVWVSSAPQCHPQGREEDLGMGHALLDIGSG